MKSKSGRRSHPTLVFLSVAGDDRAGIIAEITQGLYRLGCNLEDISMTLLDEKFAMMLFIAVDRERQFAKLSEYLKSFQKKTGIICSWVVLRSKKSAIKKSAASQGKGNSILIRAIGPDRTGIVAQVSGLIAQMRLNITDLHTRLMPVASKGAKALYALMLEVELPENSKKLKALQSKLRLLSSRLGIEIQCSRVESLPL